jgi:hypothetical protein
VKIFVKVLIGLLAIAAIAISARVGWWAGFPGGSDNHAVGLIVNGGIAAMGFLWLILGKEMWQLHAKILAYVCVFVSIIAFVLTTLNIAIWFYVFVLHR